MPTFPTVHAAIKSRLTANFNSIAVKWPNDPDYLPDDPEAFAYVDVILDRPELAAFGGGIGSNLQRTSGRIEVSILAKQMNGVEQSYAWAEAICAVFRGQHVDDIRYGVAQVIPGDGKIDDGNYANTAMAWIDFNFDQAT